MSEVKYKICSKCGAQMQIEEGVMTSSIPPMYRYHCPVCGGLEFDTEKYPMPEVINDLTIHPYPDLTRDFDWQAFRAEAAKDFVSAILAGGANQTDNEGKVFRTIEDIVDGCVVFADVLIAKLKEDGKD